MLIIACFTLVAFASCHRDEVFRTIPQGKLVGKAGVDRKGNDFYSFLSIPFAKPPVGGLRFADPVEPESWTGIRNASVGHPVCPQIIQKRHIGAEDCLYLNVHTPVGKRCAKDLKPVFVFIHGGGFIEGTGQDYGAEFLMPECVVLVTINYRLGLFGFLNSDDLSLGIPGNAGMKDQVMALRWVQKNIGCFGGDPRNVMIVGQSAGAASVHQLMLSPHTKGFIHKVVAMSGNGEQAWASGLRNNLKPVGARKGIRSNNPREILRALRKLSTYEILAAQDDYALGVPIDAPFECSPSVEPSWSGAFLTSRPIDVINSGKYSKVPLMIGYTNKDGVIIEIVDRLAFGRPRIYTDFKEMIPHNINQTGIDLDAIGLDIKNFYFGPDEVPNGGNLETSAELFTGLYFISALPLVLQAHLRQQKAPVYLYKFSADTELNYVKYLTPETAHYEGAIHMDDLSYLFTTIHTPEIHPNSDEDIAIDNVVKLFCNFAKSGNPSDDWSPITKEVYNYLDIGIRLESGVNPDHEQYLFWDEFYRKYM